MTSVIKNNKVSFLHKERPYILVSNDDGPNSLGLKMLLGIIKEFADVVAVIPDRKRSGCSMSITNREHLILRESENFGIDGVKVLLCSGTPTDCVKLALSNVVTRKPDMIISGINKGYNLSVTSLNSGTVAVGIEAASKGFCGICLSYEKEVKIDDIKKLEEIVKYVVSKVYRDKSIYSGFVLNINIPSVLHDKVDDKLFMSCHSDKGYWENEWTLESKYAGNKEFKRTGHLVSSIEEGSDVWAVKHGYISIVKLKPCFQEC